MLKATIGLLVLAAMGTEATWAQARGHKSDADLARMTPEQRVQEYCDHYYHQGFWELEYMELLKSYVLRDGTQAIPSLINIIDQYDPTNSKARSRKANAWCFAATGLLSQLDERCVRLRATEEGKKAIEAEERLVRRMQAAAPGEKYTDWFEGASSLLRAMQGVNFSDDSIRDTLRIKYGIRLSDTEMLGLVKYLVANDPRYPSLAEGEIYRDHSDLNEAGNPRICVVVKNPERFYRLYLSYKAGTPP